VSSNGSVATLVQNGIDVIVFGEIGLISVGRINSTDRVNMSIVNIRELDVNNQLVGVNENHNVDLVGFQYTLGAIFETQVDGIRATAANISTILLDNSQVVITVFMLEESGQLVLGADNHDASAGAVKILVDVLDWPFCVNGGSGANACGTNEVGAILEVTMEVVTLNRTSRRVSDTGIAFGNDKTTLYVPREARLGNDLEEISEVYPIIALSTNRVSDITMGIPKFNSTGALEFALILNDRNAPTTKVVTITTGGLQLKVDQGSGIISFGQRNSRNLIQTFVSSIRELDAAGNPVGVDSLGAAGQHNTSALTSSLFNTTGQFNVRLGTANAKAINSTTRLVDTSVMRMTAMLFSNTGRFALGNETFNVNGLSMKFNIEIDNWPFCSASGDGARQCNGNDIGDSLEVEIQLDGFSEVLRSTDATNVFALGNTADVFLSRQVLVDGDLIDMPDGFPRVDIRDGHSVIVLRIPAFAQNVVYDPVITLTSQDKSGASTVFAMSALLGAFMGLVALFC